MRFVILGAPSTKKTSQRVIRVKGRVMVVPSERTDSWTKSAVLQLQAQNLKNARCLLPPGLAADPIYGSAAGMWRAPVNCAALIYREANRGDLVNYMQALADALEEAGVIANDRLITAWDGSRLLVDRVNPRIELELTPMEGP